MEMKVKSVNSIPGVESKDECDRLVKRLSYRLAKSKTWYFSKEKKNHLKFYFLKFHDRTANDNTSAARALL